ncbi:hypothetical protein GGI07_002644 [Coemansia sp. Benny D115]|nr:hypothetical protein GGI07_002644 [Coemansia sp. Benny D115]
MPTPSNTDQTAPSAMQARLPKLTPEFMEKFYPGNLRLVQVSVINRHGERTPSKGDLPGITPKSWDLCAQGSHFFKDVLQAFGLKTTTQQEFMFQDEIRKFGGDMGADFTSALSKTAPTAASDKSACAKGQLTDLGRQSMYALGAHLRKLYIDNLGLLPKAAPATVDNLYLRATMYTRTFESLQHLLGGLYPGLQATGTPQFRINVRPPERETIFPDLECAAMVRHIADFSRRSLEISQDEHRKLYEDIQAIPELKKYVTKEYQPGKTHMAILLHDILGSMRAHGIALPEKIDENMINRITRGAAIEHLDANWLSADLPRMVIGGLLRELVDTTVTAVKHDRNGAAKSTQKFAPMAIYSGHDTTIGPLLATLTSSRHESKSINLKWPPYATSIRMELLHDSTTPRPAVRPGWEDDQADFSENGLQVPYARRVRPVTVPESLYHWPNPNQRNPRATRDYYVRVWFNDQVLELPACRDPGAHHSALGSSVCTLEGFYRQVARFVTTEKEAAKECKIVRGGAFFNSFKKLVSVDGQKTTLTSDTADKRKSGMSILQRRGGHARGQGMHISIPIRAKNVEKAWGIWSSKLRQPTDQPPALKDLVDLIMLLLESPAVPLIGGQRIATEEEEVRRRHRDQAAYRLAMVLRSLFAQNKQIIEGSGGLGLKSIDEYERILGLLASNKAESVVGSGGNTPTIGAENIQSAADVGVGRLAQLVLIAALNDKIYITPEMVCLALKCATISCDVAAARDTLQLHNMSLALSLDPKLPPSGTLGQSRMSNVTKEVSLAIVEELMRVVVVGQNPAVYSTAFCAKQEAEAEEYLYDPVGDTTNAVALEDMLEEARRWRVQTAERIYRLFVSAGMTEVPSPDKSLRPALQGSSVPTLSLLATMLSINCAVRNVEEAVIIYDTLVATAGAASEKIEPTLWSDVFNAVVSTEQAWLAARVLGDMVSSGTIPTQSMYEQYVNTLCNVTESEDGFITSIADLCQGDMPQAALDNIICALAGSPSELGEFAALRVEQALQISGLPTDSSQSADSTAPVSDAAARAILSAMISANQIPRARRLVELWGAQRPELVNSQSIAALIIGLSYSGEFAQALDVFAGVQDSTPDLSVDILSAVMRVYVMAGDYEEAASVAMRIRAIVRDSPENTNKLMLDIGHLVYNSMIRAYCETDQITEAMRVLEEMRSSTLHANSETYAILAQTMSTIRSYDGLKLVVALANVDYNMAAVEESSGLNTGVLTCSVPLPLNTDYYNSLIEAYGRMAEPAKALQIWEIMRQRCVAPNNLTATLIIDICGWNERVHWDEDMQPNSRFAVREVPADHIYTGMPFIHMHYLANAMEQLQQAGLVFSQSNYRHFIEAMLRLGFLEDVMDMTIARYEDSKESKEFADKAKDLAKQPDRMALGEVLANMRKKLAPETDEEDDSSQSVERAAAEKERWEREMHQYRPKTMDDFRLEIPLNQDIVDTLYGMIKHVRNTCLIGEDVDRADMPFVQRASPHLLERLDLHQARLDHFLKTKRPDLSSASNRAMQEQDEIE